MGKPIANKGDFIFGNGGILIDIANINGKIETNVNIYRQRSSKVFDLILNSGEIAKFISITSTDKNGQNLDPTANSNDLSLLINDNSFFIKATTESNQPGFVISLQLNKAVLSNGGAVYNLEKNLQLGYSIGRGIPDLSNTVVISNSDVPADNKSTSNIYVRLYDKYKNIITETQDLKFIADNQNVVFSSYIANLRKSGLYSIKASCPEIANVKITIKVNGISLDKVIDVSFIDPSSTPSK